MSSFKETSMGLGFIIIMIVSAIGLIYFVVDLDFKRNDKCREQFGQDWAYANKRTTDCVNLDTGESRFFKG